MPGILTIINTIGEILLTIYTAISDICKNRRMDSFEKRFSTKTNNNQFHEEKPGLIDEFERIKKEILANNVGPQTLSLLSIALSSTVYHAENVPFSQKDIDDLVSFSKTVRSCFLNTESAEKFNWNDALYQIQRIIQILQRGENQ